MAAATTAMAMSLDDDDAPQQVFELKWSCPGKGSGQGSGQGLQIKEVHLPLTATFGALAKQAELQFGLAPGCKLSGLTLRKDPAVSNARQATTASTKSSILSDQPLHRFNLKPQTKTKVLVIGTVAAAVEDLVAAERQETKRALADEEENYAAILAKLEEYAATIAGVPKGMVEPREKAVILKHEHLMKRVSELAYYGYVDQMRRLLRGEPPKSFDSGAIDVAIAGKQLAAVRYLLSMRFKPEMQTYLASIMEQPLLRRHVLLAARLARFEILQFLLDVVCMGIEAADTAYQAGQPAPMAVGLNDDDNEPMAPVRVLLSDVLSTACENGHLGLAKWLYVHRKARVTIGCLEAAIRYERSQTCQWLVAMTGVKATDSTFHLAIQCDSVPAILTVVWSVMLRDNLPALGEEVVMATRYICRKANPGQECGHYYGSFYGAPETERAYQTLSHRRNEVLRFLFFTALASLPEPLQQEALRANIGPWLSAVSGLSDLGRLTVVIEAIIGFRQHGCCKPAIGLDLSRPLLSQFSNDTIAADGLASALLSECVAVAARQCLRLQSLLKSIGERQAEDQKRIKALFQRPGERSSSSSGVSQNQEQSQSSSWNRLPMRLSRASGTDHTGEELVRLESSLKKTRAHHSLAQGWAWEANEVLGLLVSQGCDPKPILDQLTDSEFKCLKAALMQRLDEERWVSNVVIALPDAVPALLELPHDVILLMAQFSAKSDGRHERRYLQELGDVLSCRSLLQTSPISSSSSCSSSSSSSASSAPNTASMVDDDD